MNSEFYFSVFMLFLALGKAKGPVESPTVKPFLNITPPPKTESLDSPEAGELTLNCANQISNSIRNSIKNHLNFLLS